MKDDEFRAEYGRDKPSLRERQTAARIRVRADKKLGRSTPQWIVDLAKENEEPHGN